MRSRKCRRRGDEAAVTSARPFNWQKRSAFAIVPPGRVPVVDCGAVLHNFASSPRAIHHATRRAIMQNQALASAFACSRRGSASGGDKEEKSGQTENICKLNVL